MVPDTAWRGMQSLPSDLVDLLIMQCDNDGMRDVCLNQSQLGILNPFSAFPVAQMDCATLATDVESLTGEELVVFGEFPMALDAGLQVGLVEQIPQALRAFPDTTTEEHSLFHHYMAHIAVIMMPYEHTRNPWKTHYPIIALNRSFPDQVALYHAMLAQAAFNISDPRAGDDGMMTAGCRHYALAIQQLLPLLAGKKTEFGSLLASIMTLLFAETYRGQARTWKHHLHGARRLFGKYRESDPWKVTDFVCVSIQSLNIIKVISETSDPVPNVGDRLPFQDWENCNLNGISSTFDFGFTIGASATTIECISRITQIRKAAEPLGNRVVDISLEEILASLNSSLQKELDSLDGSPRSQDNNEDNVIVSEHIPLHSQRVSVIYSAYIYLYRGVFDVPPQRVQTYVSKAFEHVSNFYACSRGNFSIWSAFMAAVEATTEENVTSARSWLDWTTSFGLGNRASMRRIVEEVWARREAQCRIHNIPRGSIPVDWRMVMQELDCDVLMV